MCFMALINYNNTDSSVTSLVSPITDKQTVQCNISESEASVPVVVDIC